MDTSEDAPNVDVQPQVHIFNNEDIQLKNDVTLVAQKLVDQNCQSGDILITSDGTTLLGGDDKAGIAIIMTFLEHVMQDPELLASLPGLQIIFTPDEEIG